MDKYKIGKVLGDGTFGSVLKAVNIKTGEIVAIKKMKSKYVSWDKCINLLEIKSLMKFHHPNVVRLYEIIKENNTLYLVFEYMDQNVYQFMKERQKPINEIQIRNIIYQTLQGLNYMHKKGYFHRDLKPENLLEQNGTVKLADFGLAREIRSRPPFTDYVSTRWYRAPETILRAPNYNSPIDIFAIGAIMAELYRLWPLFPGASERDQIVQICQILGTPEKEDWPNGYQLAAQVGYQFPKFNKPSLQSVIPTASPEAIDLMGQMMRYNPVKRPSCAQLLQHEFFRFYTPIPRSIQLEGLQLIEFEEEEENEQNNNNEEANYQESMQDKFMESEQFDQFLDDILNDKEPKDTMPKQKQKQEQNTNNSQKHQNNKINNFSLQILQNARYKPSAKFQLVHQ